MKTITMLNIKGGVAKTTSAIAFAQILHDEYNYRVLLVDGDQQANTTGAMGLEACPLTVADLLTSRDLIIEDVIQTTVYGVDVIPAGISLMTVNKEVMLDVSRPQQFRLKRQFAKIEDRYDYCIFDCPPDITMTVINALAFADDVLVPIRADRYGFDGLYYVVNSIQEMKEYNSNLRLAGGFLTMYQKGTNLSSFALDTLQEFGIPAMETTIRASVKVGESTFATPIMTYAPRSNAANDYRALVAEYLAKENING